MLRKLALGGIRSRFRDYAVLFSGLVIASAVFYMFMALATNKAFLTANSPLGMTSFIFMFGEALLIIITMVYIVYANTFLMSMRQRDYAMFMMLGAKSTKIAELIFIETVAVGLLAAVVGTALGIGLTAVAGNVLINMLHAPATHFSAFWLPALLWTFGFFIAMFVLAALFNARSLLKTPMLDLLHAAQTPNRLQKKRAVLVLQAVLAVVLLAIGYWAMRQVTGVGLLAIGIALVTIVLGTYFLFNSLLIWLIELLKRSHAFAAKGLHTFTLSQLSFRIRDYTKILSVVALLFALALGAITVGLGFQHEIPKMVGNQTSYDMVLVAPNANEKKQAKNLTDVTQTVTYTQKVAGSQIYFDAGELKQHPLQFMVWAQTHSKPVSVSDQAALRGIQEAVNTQLTQFTTAQDGNEARVAILDHAQFEQTKGATRQVVTYQVGDFVANYDVIENLVTAQAKRYQATEQSGQKLYSYIMINGIYSGLAFMGFFLGIAFLAMLASTLMFKILSGASYDQSRYLMLQKIGTRPSLLKRSIRQEIGALFLFPGLLGIIHVLFGLQLFTFLLQAPYANLWQPFGIFLILYIIYYGLTVWLYENIVLTKTL